MVGQTKLLETLNSIPFSQFPKSSLFLGEKGSGRHTIINDLATRFGVSVLDISEDISFDYLNELALVSIPCFYLIDVSKIDEKKQNVILKFVEEPPLNAYVILLCENVNEVIETILNRCIVFELDRYTKEQLLKFVEVDNGDLIVQVCNTPGQVKEMNRTNNIKELFDLCNTIVEKLSVANYSNALIIVNKINYKDEYDKFDINIFFNSLLLTIYNKYVETLDKKYYSLFELTNKYNSKLRDSRINKEILMENYLTNAWELMRE